VLKLGGQIPPKSLLAEDLCKILWNFRAVCLIGPKDAMAGMASFTIDTQLTQKQQEAFQLLKEISER
jgi:hypothetical protein